MKLKWTPREDRAPFSDYQALLERGFKLGRELGCGTFAKVYKVEAVPELGGEDLACKIFDRSKHKIEFGDKFIPREMDILMKINHPFIIQLKYIFRRESKIYILMQLAENGDLLEYIRRHGALPEAQAHIWFSQLLSALQYLHNKDIAHRDLKCENILLNNHFNVKLADFGFSRFCRGDRGQRELSRTFCGSPSYAAPEVVSTVAYNPKLADIWSLGVVLYIMTNGVMPFEEDNLPRLLQKQVQKKWTFDRKARTVLSWPVKQLIRQILEPDVMKRLSLCGISRHPWLNPPSASGDAPIRYYTAISPR